MGQEGLHGIDDVTEVRLEVFGERGGNADDDGGAMAGGGHVEVWLEETYFKGTLDVCIWDVLDVGATGIEGADLFWINVKGIDGATGAAEV
jgi:hypothetical protein